jgi:hypothetical protein
MNYQYPETVILSITTHGCIGFEQTTNNNEVETFKLDGDPKSKIILVTSSIPGFSNFQYEKTINYNNYHILKDYNTSTKWNNSYIKSMFSFFSKQKKYSPGIQSTSPLEEFAKKKACELKKRDKSDNIEYIKQCRQRKFQIVNVDFIDYFKNINEGYTIDIIKNGGDVIQKYYTYDGSDNKTSDNFIIKILNVPDEHNDVMKSLNIEPDSDGVYSTNMKDIVNFLSSKGVKKFLIFDFTCNHFEGLDPNNKLTARDERSMRKSILSKINVSRTKIPKIHKIPTIRNKTGFFDYFNNKIQNNVSRYFPKTKKTLKKQNTHDKKYNKRNII